VAVQTDLTELNDRCIGKSIVQRFPVTSHEFSGKRWWVFFGRVGGWNVVLPSFLLWYSAQLVGQSCQLYAPVTHHHQGNSWVLFSVRDWVDSVSSEGREKFRSLEHFQGLYRDQNLKPPVLWHSGKIIEYV